MSRRVPPRPAQVRRRATVDEVSLMMTPERIRDLYLRCWRMTGEQFERSMGIALRREESKRSAALDASGSLNGVT